MDDVGQSVEDVGVEVIFFEHGFFGFFVVVLVASLLHALIRSLEVFLQMTVQDVGQILQLVRRQTRHAQCFNTLAIDAHEQRLADTSRRYLAHGREQFTEHFVIRFDLDRLEQLLVHVLPHVPHVIIATQLGTVKQMRQ